MRVRAERWTAIILGGIAVLGVLLIWRLPEVAAWRWYVMSGKPEMNTAAVSLAPPLQWLDDYYAIANLGHATYAIGEPHYGQCNFSYLLLGSKRALLFDTGPGIHDIRKAVRSLTRLPVIAMPSHLHFDHVGNLGLFAEVALPDLPSLRAQMRGGTFALGLNQYLGFTEGFKRPAFPVTQWIRSDTDIDLGDRQVRLLSVPGHTPDSVVLMDRQANALFSGDFIYPTDIYAFLPGANLGDYAASAHRVLQQLDVASSIYGGHGCENLPSVDVPVLHRSDVADLERALSAAQSGKAAGETGWYPRSIPVNTRMKLLAKYPWMQP